MDPKSHKLQKNKTNKILKDNWGSTHTDWISNNTERLLLICGGDDDGVILKITLMFHHIIEIFTDESYDAWNLLQTNPGGRGLEM